MNRSEATADVRFEPRQQVVAWRGGSPLRRQTLFAEAAALATSLPRGDAIANYCSDRYRFLVAFVAALMSDRLMLLPSDRTAHTLRELADLHPGICCVGDDGEMPTVATLPTLRLVCDGLSAADIEVPQFVVPPARVVAQVFTSGSTGKPVANPKTWGTLVAKAGLFRDVLRMPADLPISIVATVPAQHMYGFECSVLAPLSTPSSVHVGRPLLPPAVAAALASLPAPRVLVTTPIHLRALVAARQPLPEIARIVSATTRLGADLAARVENEYTTQVLEIYGFTEAGIVASRRTACDENFHCREDMRIGGQAGCHFIEAPHLPGPVPITDLIELASEHSFRFAGRAEDLVDIAGRRASLAGLNAILLEVDGVVDGAFVTPADAVSGSAKRLLAFVVAPGCTAQYIRRELGRRIDPVFLPRRIHFVAALPRNDTGKLTQSAIELLLRQASPKAA